MTVTLTDLASLRSWPFDEVIDVRAPCEFALDHVPGAVNLPVLSDAERAQVGTIYKQVDRFQARKVGAALVARNAARHLDEALADKPGGWRPLVYCWRGGQRSGSFASILAQIGWRVDTLEGGYRSYRRLVVAAVQDGVLAHRIIVLDGNTGTAKTAILAGLCERGHQVIDLEALSAHRGSVFGALSTAQPSQKCFEGALAVALAGMDPARPVLVEAESSRIGTLVLPRALWAVMGSAPRIRLEAPPAERARYLVRAYGDLTAEPAALSARLEALKTIQGAERVAHWRALAQARDFEALARELIDHHYDPRYAKARGRGRETWEVRVSVARLDAAGVSMAVGQVERAIAALTPPR